MKKEGIQTRKRKPKNHSSIGGSLAGPSGIHKTDIKSSLLGESSVSKSLYSLFLLTPPIYILTSVMYIFIFELSSAKMFRSLMMITLCSFTFMSVSWPFI